MGKKNMPPSLSQFQASPPERVEPSNNPPGPTDVLEVMRDLLARDVLQLLLQERPPQEMHGRRDLEDQVSERACWTACAPGQKR